MTPEPALKTHRLLKALLVVIAALPAAHLRAQSDQAAAGPTPLAQQINPPFGLEWGESADRLDRLLKGAGATVVDRHDVGGREAWTVEGLIQQGLRRTVFYFRDSMLVEVELQYQSPDWDVAKYDDFMAQVRRRIEQKFGAGQLIARTRESAGNNIMQTLVGYKWDENNTSIQLFYFSAENATQSYRTVSVHYKWL
jgi:hypothetical protein